MIKFFTLLNLLNILILSTVYSMISSARITEVVLGLLIVFISFIPLFILLGFDFLALTTLIIYAGAVIIFFLFIVITINVSEFFLPELNKINFVNFLFSLFVSISFFIISNPFLFENNQQTLLSQHVTQVYKQVKLQQPNIKVIGKLLYTEYKEIIIQISFLLILSMIGSMFLTFTLNTKKS